MIEVFGQQVKKEMVTMATCGKCKEQGQTVAHIRECFAAQGTVLTKVEAPAPKALPNSKYALEDADGTIIFYEVRAGKKGTRWEGFTFLDRLVGAPGVFDTYPVKGMARAAVLARLQQDPKEAAVRFSKHFTVCAACSSPLTDPESMATGLGPVCAARF